MSTTSNTMSRCDTAADRPFQGLIGILGGWWAVYIDWRLHRMALAQLRNMSDRELKDIGLFRTQIEAVVRGDLARDPTLRLRY